MSKKKDETVFTLPEKLVTVLKNFSQLNPSLIIYPDKVEVISTHKSCIGIYPFEEPLPFEGTLGLYDTPSFLQVLSFYKNPSIKKNPSNIIVSEGSSKATLLTTADEMLPKVLVQNKYTPDDVKKRLGSVGCDLEFVISAEKLNMLLKMSSLLKSEFIFFETDNDNIRITVANQLEASNDSWELSITGEDVTTNSLETPIKISVSELKLIPSDYKIGISAKGMSQWESAIGVEYLIGVTLVA